MISDIGLTKLEFKITQKFSRKQQIQKTGAFSEKDETRNTIKTNNTLIRTM